MTSGALPSNRIALGDWQAVNLFNCQFTAAQVLHNPPSYSNGCSPVVIGLRNTTALSVILFQSVMSRPKRNLPNLYELWKNICQTAIGWRIAQIGWRIVNLQKQSYCDGSVSYLYLKSYPLSMVCCRERNVCYSSRICSGILRTSVKRFF